MRRCDYCDESFPDEEAYLAHLRREHDDELGPIDRRRVHGPEDDDGGSNAAVYAAALGGVALLGIVVYLVFFTGGSGGSEPTPYANGAVHYHGSITVSIDGQTLDFSQPRYQLQDQHFHFENGNGDRWHVHSRGVSLAYAMRTLGIEVTENGVTFEGTTYRAGESDSSVTVTVNGESVTPASYVLQEGDQVRIVAERS